MKGIVFDTWHGGFETQNIFDVSLNFAKENFTDLFLQVRRRGDALYESEYEPYIYSIPSGYYIPTTDIDDLLGYACKNKGTLKVHAYLTVLQLWREKNANTGQFPDEWLMKDNGGIVFLNPRIPEAQDYIVNICKDVCKYDIDGLFLEKLRYCGDLLWTIQDGKWEVEPSTPAERDEAVTTLMRRIYTEVKKIKDIPISVCVKTQGDDFTSSKTQTHCDWSQWLTDGILDYAYPMLINKTFDHIETWSGMVEPNPKTIPILGCYSTLAELIQQKNLFTDYIIYSLANFSKDKKDKVSLKAVIDG